MEGDFSTSTTGWPALAMSRAAWMPAMAAAQHQGPLGDRHLDGLERLVALDLRHHHPHQVDGLGGGELALLVHPGTLLPEVGHLAQVGVEPGLGHGVAECGLVHARRAGRHHHAREPVFGDGRLDQALAGIRAHVLVVHAVDHAGHGPRGLGHPGAVDGAADVLAAVTDEYADT